MSPLLSPIKFVHHGAVRFEEGGKTIWIDPYQLPAAQPKADVVVVTHEHDDHYSPQDIRAVQQPGTRYITTAVVAEMMRQELGIAPQNIVEVSPGAAPVAAGGIEITPVYTENKNHPRGRGFGVVLALSAGRYYLSGDTDVLDKNIVCDVLLCVCDGKWNMLDYMDRAPKEILAMHTRPQIVVPYHFTIGDTPDGGYRLAEKLNGMGIPAQVLGE